MSDIVIYVGIFSKVLFPALRIGYLVGSHNSVNIFGYAKYLADRQARKTAYQERNIFGILLSLDRGSINDGNFLLNFHKQARHSIALANLA